jgi:hypothetical protein
MFVFCHASSEGEIVDGDDVKLFGRVDSRSVTASLPSADGSRLDVASLTLDFHPDAQKGFALCFSPRRINGPATRDRRIMCERRVQPLTISPSSVNVTTIPEPRTVGDTTPNSESRSVTTVGPLRG